MSKKVDKIVHTETIALLPFFDEYGNYCTEIIETTGIYRVDVPPCQVVKASCEFYGSTYDGARKASCSILKSKQMLPIAISSICGVYFFPTTSPENENNQWLALNHIEDVEPYGEKGAKITLTGGKELILNQSPGAIRAKVQRTAQLKFIVEKRNKKELRILVISCFHLEEAGGYC